MNFIVSSTELLSKLQIVSKVIASKNSLPILDYFLFDFKDGILTIRASDLETTLITRIKLANSNGDGTIAIEAKRLIEVLKEFSEQPLTFEINEDTLKIDIQSQNGKYSIVGYSPEDFPKSPQINEETGISVKFKSDIVTEGIHKTHFASANDELRPIMNGIFVEINPDSITFVATDAQKLVRYRRTDISVDASSSFILPKKPANIIRNSIKHNLDLTLSFDEKNACFEVEDYIIICRLVDGKYPPYETVIPKNNPNILIVDRVDVYNTIKRVSVFSDPSTNLIRAKILGNELRITAQDLDFSTSANESIACQYDGANMSIGFRSAFLLEIIANLSSSEVKFEMSEPSKAALIFPVDNENEKEDILMLIMPMMITEDDDEEVNIENNEE